jgi:hypothetical protein
MRQDQDHHDGHVVVAVTDASEVLDELKRYAEDPANHIASPVGDGEAISSRYTRKIGPLQVAYAVVIANGGLWRELLVRIDGHQLGPGEFKTFADIFGFEGMPAADYEARPLDEDPFTVVGMQELSDA